MSSALFFFDYTSIWRTDKIITTAPFFTFRLSKYRHCHARFWNMWADYLWWTNSKLKCLFGYHDLIQIAKTFSPFGRKIITISMERSWIQQGGALLAISRRRKRVGREHFTMLLMSSSPNAPDSFRRNRMERTFFQILIDLSYKYLWAPAKLGLSTKSRRKEK